MDFRRVEQLFLSSLGSEIYQLKTQTGAGLRGHFFCRALRSSAVPIPIPSAGSIRTKGYELVEELKLLENAPPRGGGSRGPAQSRSVPRRREGHHSR